jgi:hypothetical protein
MAKSGSVGAEIEFYQTKSVTVFRDNFEQSLG